MGDEIRVGPYAPWMRPQVVSLFSDEYGRDPEVEERNFVRFYEHPFQSEHGIMLAALDGERVVGFQSYFYWPYRHAGERLQTFQSGRSLVSRDSRGKGIFGRLLKYLEQNPTDRKIDFLIGFPVERSYRSFIRNGWSNPIDLAWYARVLHPISVLRSGGDANLGEMFDETPEEVAVHYEPEVFSLSKDADFESWRAQYSSGAGHRYFHYRKADRVVRFALKPNRRARILELILGDVVYSHAERALVDAGVRALVRALRPLKGVTILSVALNPELADDVLLPVLRRRGFVRLRRKIHFIVKSRLPGLEDSTRWRLYRSDIDTW